MNLQMYWHFFPPSVHKRLLLLRILHKGIIGKEMASQGSPSSASPSLSQSEQQRQASRQIFEWRARRYLHQLTVGCGDLRCRSKFCASSIGKSPSFWDFSLSVLLFTVSSSSSCFPLVAGGTHQSPAILSMISLELASKPKDLFCIALPTEIIEAQADPPGTSGLYPPHAAPSLSPDIGDEKDPEYLDENAPRERPAPLESSQPPFLSRLLSSSQFMFLSRPALPPVIHVTGRGVSEEISAKE